MKLFSLLCTCVLIAASTLHASAENPSPAYIAPRLSLTLQHASSNAELMSRSWGPKTIYAAKPGGSLALGLDLQPHFDLPFRLEVEYGTWEHVSKTGKARIRRMPLTFRANFAMQTLLFNACWDIPLTERVIPYVGIGAGLAFVRTRITALEESHSR